MDIRATISRIPPWGWIAGAGVALVGAFYLSKSSTSGTPVQTGLDSSTLGDALSGLNDALNNLGGNGSSNSGSGSTGSGSGSTGGGVDPTVNPTTGGTTVGTSTPATGPTVISGGNTSILDSVQKALTPTVSGIVAGTYYSRPESVRSTRGPLESDIIGNPIVNAIKNIRPVSVQNLGKGPTREDVIGNPSRQPIIQTAVRPASLLDKVGPLVTDKGQSSFYPTSPANRVNTPTPVIQSTVTVPRPASVAKTHGALESDVIGNRSVVSRVKSVVTTGRKKAATTVKPKTTLASRTPTISPLAVTHAAGRGATEYDR